MWFLPWITQLSHVVFTMNNMNYMNFTTPFSCNHKFGSHTALLPWWHRCVSIHYLWLHGCSIDIHDIHEIHGVKTSETWVTSLTSKQAKRAKLKYFYFRTEVPFCFYHKTVFNILLKEKGINDDKFFALRNSNFSKFLSVFYTSISRNPYINIFFHAEAQCAQGFISLLFVKTAQRRVLWRESAEAPRPRTLRCGSVWKYITFFTRQSPWFFYTMNFMNNCTATKQP